jgi:hypothetical protein
MAGMAVLTPGLGAAVVHGSTTGVHTSVRTHVYTCALGLRIVYDSILGPDLVSKKRGDTGHDDTVRTVTGENAGVRILSGPIVRTTGENNRA